MNSFLQTECFQVMNISVVILITSVAKADLLMKLQKYEGTSNKLENLLQTKHVRQGSPSLAREARQWLQKCYMQVEGADEEEIQRALECSLTIDDHQQKVELTKRPIVVT